MSSFWFRRGYDHFFVHHQNVFCQSCREAGAKLKATTQSIKCTGCGEHKAQARFEREDVYNFFARRQNVFCQSCLEAGAKGKATTDFIKCTGCDELKAQPRYFAADVDHFFVHRQNVFCRSCRQAGIRAGSKLKRTAHPTYTGTFLA